MEKILSRIALRREEDAIQAEIIDLLKVAAIPSLMWFHPANGGKRPINTARRLKEIGVVAGVPDLMLIAPEGRIFQIEVKTATGSLTKEQRLWRDHCREHENPWALVRSRNEAQDVLSEWGLLRITKNIRPKIKGE